MTWIAIILGAIAGSVANALVYRLPKNISWWKGRSQCPSCKHGLGWQDLIPLLSYLSLKGKCRYCHEQISSRYFLLELILAVGFAFIFSSGFTLITICLAVMAFTTVIIAAMDWETMLVSEAIVLILAVSVLLFNYLVGTPVTSSLIGLLVGIGVIGGIWLLTRGNAMGFGDVEIVAVLGWWLGWPKITVALWSAFVVGAIVGVMLMVTKKTKLKTRIAFGPFLVVGAWIAHLVGATMLSWISFLP